MAYPIIESPIGNDVLINIFWRISGVNYSANLNDYVVGVRGGSGARPSAFYSNLEPGILTVELYDVESNATINPGMRPGAQLVIGTATVGNFFAGRVRDTDVVYSWEQAQGRMVPTTTLTVADVAADYGNFNLPENSFNTKTDYPLMLWEDLESVFLAKTGREIDLPVHSPPAVPYTGLGSFVRQMGGLDFANICARSLYFRAAINGDAQTVSVLPTTIPTSFLGMITDGTDTSGFTGIKWGMTNAEYGYTSSTVVKSVELTNNALVKAPKVANDKASQDVQVSYFLEQAIEGFENKEEAEVILAQSAYQVNLLNNTGSSSVSPNSIWPADYVAWGVSPTMTYNSHPVAAGRVTTAWSSRAIPVMNLDVQDTFVSSYWGQGVGNWIFRYKSRTVTAPSHSMGARIVWYNSAGTVLRTDTGSFTNVANAAWVTHTLSVATPPTGAVTAQAYVVSNTAQAVGYQFYVTEAMFTRDVYSGSPDFWDGDTADNTSYIYAWTGQQGNSQSIMAYNYLDGLADTVLANNGLVKKIKSVQINMQEPVSYGAPYTSNIDAAIGTLLTPAYNSSAGKAEGIKICLNGVEGNYRVVGYDFDLTPTSFTSTLHVVKH